MIVLIILQIAFIAWVGWTVFQGYRAAQGDWWQRLLASAKGSATILWAKFSAAVTAAAGLVAVIPDYLGDPAISEAIKAYLKPEYVAAFVVVTQLITIWARHRTL